MMQELSGLFRTTISESNENFGNLLVVKISLGKDNILDFPEAKNES